MANGPGDAKNVALVEEAAAATETMQLQKQQLVGAVSVFKLNYKAVNSMSTISLAVAETNNETYSISV